MSITYTVGSIWKKITTELSTLYSPSEAGIIADMVLMHLLQYSRVQLRMNSTQALTSSQTDTLERYLVELLQHRPIQYVLGRADFYGLSFRVNEHVLIPRPETEELVALALQWIGKKPYKVLEIGTGSGCISISMKKNAPQLELHSLDISAAALDVARQNAHDNKVAINFIQADFTDERIWPTLGDFDIIISNPPYIAEQERAEMEPHVLDYEPANALFVPDDDVLLFYRKILAFSLEQGPPAAIFLELNQLQAAATKHLFEQHYPHSRIVKDINNNDRILMVAT